MLSVYFFSFFLSFFVVWSASRSSSRSSENFDQKSDLVFSVPFLCLLLLAFWCSRSSIFLRSFRSSTPGSTSRSASWAGSARRWAGSGARGPGSIRVIGTRTSGSRSSRRSGSTARSTFRLSHRLRWAVMLDMYVKKWNWIESKVSFNFPDTSTVPCDCRPLLNRLQ